MRLLRTVCWATLLVLSLACEEKGPAPTPSAKPAPTPAPTPSATAAASAEPTPSAAASGGPLVPIDSLKAIKLGTIKNAPPTAKWEIYDNPVVTNDGDMQVNIKDDTKIVVV